MSEKTDQFGVVVIGRNEGDRLRRCLASVAEARCPIVYVDSGSTDASVAAARDAGATVVELDLDRPFTAARARNAGFVRLQEIAPELSYVQFVDGDCEIAPKWLNCAARDLQCRPDVAAVAGRLRERNPQASVYNRLCDLEWDGPTGEVPACGGVAMYRVAHLTEVGGFDPSVASGEEPELCLRLRRHGLKIVRLAEEMGWHDAAMMEFGQWWRRAVRGGYGGLDVARRFERGDGVFRAQIRSARLWALGYPLGLVAATLLVGLAAGAPAASGTGLLVLSVLPAQALRLALRGRRRGLPWRSACAYGILLVIGKWANLVGQVRCWRDRRAGRGAQLIEHKRPGIDGPPTAATRGRS